MVREGDVLSGKFQVERVLGQGGMGMVVAARHLQLGQRVALKFMLPQALVSPEAAERFTREARAAARLRSEHVPRVLDVGMLEGMAGFGGISVPYIVMELLEGEDVASLLERGSVPLGQAVGIVVHACAALAEAHALGIVHRDLKPRNLFMTTDVEGKPLVKVLDFGISKELAPPTADTPSSLTKTSTILGSPQYMSPEQLKSSRSVDARADIWSLGVCLFELLSRRVPFDASSVAELCAIVLTEDPPHLDDVPPALDAIVQRCLEKLPAARIQTVAELATALEPWADAWARPGAERARNVLRASQQTGSPVTTAPRVSPASDTLATGPTLATWDTSESGARPKRTWPLVAIAASAFAVVLAVGALAILKLGRTTHAAAPLAPAISAPDAKSVAPPPPTQLASAETPASAEPSARQAPAAPRASTRRPVHARSGASQAPNEDRLLEGRN